MKYIGMTICALLCAGQRALSWVRCKQSGKTAPEERGLAVQAVHFQPIYIALLQRVSLTATRKQSCLDTTAAAVCTRDGRVRSTQNICCFLINRVRHETKDKTEKLTSKWENQSHLSQARFWYLFNYCSHSVLNQLMSYTYLMYRSHLSHRIWHFVLSLISQAHSI